MSTETNQIPRVIDPADWISDRRALIDAATEGPWYYGTPDDGCERTISEWMTLCAKGPDAPAANTLWTVWIDGVIISAITGDGPKSQHNAALIADSRTSLPLALKALEAVLELHEISCEGCDDGPECRTCWEAWPCDTYATIETALGIEVQSWT